jgi:hypothetical protein
VREVIKKTKDYVSFDFLSAKAQKSLVELALVYCEQSLKSGQFELRANVLNLVRSFRQTPVASLPPAFFSLVHTASVLLMMVCKEADAKVLAFTQFWLEQLDVQPGDEDLVDTYEKCLLRNTVCNLLCKLAKYVECLREAKFNIKELKSEVGVSVIQLKYLKQGSQEFTEKVKLLIVASLYKIECILNLKNSNGPECQEVLKNVEELILKYDIKDKKIDAAVKSKMTAVKKLAMAQETDELMDFKSDTDKDHRKQNVRKSAEPTVRTSAVSGRKKSPGFQIKIRDKSPVFRFRNQEGDSENASLFSKKSKSKQPGFTEYMNRKIKKEGKVESEISSMKSELRNEITYLAQIGDILKKEVTQIQKEKPKIRFTSRPRLRPDEEEGQKEEELQSEIRKKLDVILQSQEEWEKQRLMLYEKLEKLEKNMEQNKGDDSTSNEKKASQISSINSPVNHMKAISSSKAPLNSQKKGSGNSTPHSQQAASNIHKDIELGFMDMLGGQIKQGDPSMSESELFKRSLAHCIECLQNTKEPQPAQTLRHTLSQKNIEYNLECQVLAGRGRKGEGVRLRLYLKSAGYTGQPLYEQHYSFPQIHNIILGVEFESALPLFTSVSSFDRLEHFLNFILFKFISVDYL